MGFLMQSLKRKVGSTDVHGRPWRKFPHSVEEDVSPDTAIRHISNQSHSATSVGGASKSSLICYIWYIFWWEEQKRSASKILKEKLPWEDNEAIFLSTNY